MYNVLFVPDVSLQVRSSVETPASTVQVETKLLLSHEPSIDHVELGRLDSPSPIYQPTMAEHEHKPYGQPESPQSQQIRQIWQGYQEELARYEKEFIARRTETIVLEKQHLKKVRDIFFSKLREANLRVSDWKRTKQEQNEVAQSFRWNGHQLRLYEFNFRAEEDSDGEILYPDAVIQDRSDANPIAESALKQCTETIKEYYQDAYVETLNFQKHLKAIPREERQDVAVTSQARFESEMKKLVSRKREECQLKVSQKLKDEVEEGQKRWQEKKKERQRPTLPQN
ncbi:uncharacterized protein EV420DRAFT_999572 [Desarmillaria tabescens]|uniref:Uncharacterized protein n=1 Tax=Armillaria tabescens TaxID=1929756 RepID=A0AA39JKQ4_ARMTA|nr:uncharacterized protein EV420DRAFT_999572 [Desarmillaria tabescens]KAK0444532.1 hypothetical protein EV420DRAFT_999572 [Desarmillaria tabescens]